MLNAYSEHSALVWAVKSRHNGSKQTQPRKRRIEFVDCKVEGRINVTQFKKSLHPSFGRLPTIHQLSCVDCIGTNYHDSTGDNAASSFLSLWGKQPSPNRALLWSILKGTNGAGLFQKSAIVVNDGVQSHCGTTCFQHERVFLLIMSSLNFYWQHV